MNFLFKVFLFILGFVFVSCTSGKKTEAEFFEDQSSEDFLETSEETSDLENKSGKMFVSDTEPEEDEEELEFMEKSSSGIAQEDDFDDLASDDVSDDMSGDISGEEPINESEEFASQDEDTSYISEESEPTVVKKKWIPLKKIPQTTWKHDGRWINTVYIARADEDLTAINAKLYGTQDRQEELKSVNPLLKRREPKVGDKIYYNSPVRPNDSSEFLTYYEDHKFLPSSHDIRKGENIRTISTELLGHKDSWKEIWATNLQVESKWVLNKDVTIQYWPQDNNNNNNSIAMEPELEQPLADATPSEEALAEPLAENQDPTDGIEDAVIEIDPDADIPDIGDIPDSGSSPLVEGSEDLLEDPTASVDPSTGPLGDWKVKGGIVGAILLMIAVLFQWMIRNRKQKSEFDFSKTNINIDDIEE